MGETIEINGVKYYPLKSAAKLMGVKSDTLRKRIQIETKKHSADPSVPLKYPAKKPNGSWHLEKGYVDNCNTRGAIDLFAAVQRGAAHLLDNPTTAKIFTDVVRKPEFWDIALDMYKEAEKTMNARSEP